MWILSGMNELPYFNLCNCEKRLNLKYIIKKLFILLLFVIVDMSLFYFRIIRRRQLLGCPQGAYWLSTGRVFDCPQGAYMSLTTHTHTRTRARTHTHTRTRARTHAHTHTHTHAHTHIYIYIYIYICVCVCVFVCVIMSLIDMSTGSSHKERSLTTQRTLSLRGQCHSEETVTQRTLSLRGLCRSEDSAAQRTLSLR